MGIMRWLSKKVTVFKEKPQDIQESKSPSKTEAEKIEDQPVHEDIVAIKISTLLQAENSIGYRENAIGAEYNKLLADLQDRFEKNMNRHQGMEWSKILAKLKSRPDKLRSLHAMENTMGEPDVVEYNEKNGEYIFFDCSDESPEGRRKLSYNQAIQMAEKMGIKILDETQYRQLQEFGEFDLATWCWVDTPPEIRKMGNALYGKRTPDGVVKVKPHSGGYHGSFRGSLRV